MKYALVTDFDGTITRHDVYLLIAQRYMDPSAPDYFAEYRAGRIGHFEAMAEYFAHMPTEQGAVRDLLRATEPDPDLAGAANRLSAAGWDLIVVSAGSSWYIERILGEVGVRPAAIHSNRGRLEDHRGLVLERDVGSPFYGPDAGVDKTAVARDTLSRYERVAFAGDGPQDVSPALLIEPELRFARSDLAVALQRRAQAFRPFERWSQIVDALVRLTAS